MTFIRLVEEISAMTGLPKKAVRDTLKSFSALTEKKVLAGVDVVVPGLGRFRRYTIRGLTKKGKPKTAFGRPVTPRDTIHFTPYASRVREDLKRVEEILSIPVKGEQHG